MHKQMKKLLTDEVDAVEGLSHFLNADLAISAVGDQPELHKEVAAAHEEIQGVLGEAIGEKGTNEGLLTGLDGLSGNGKSIVETAIMALRSGQVNYLQHITQAGIMSGKPQFERGLGFEKHPLMDKVLKAVATE